MLSYPTGQLLDPTETNINERVKFTANTGMLLLSAANTNIDGTGADFLITAASNGTIVKTISIQAITSTSHGVVRIFLYTPGYVDLIEEINIPAVTKSGTFPAFSITLEVNFELKSGYSLLASSQTADNFAVIAEGLNYTYP